MEGNTGDLSELRIVDHFSNPVPREANTQIIGAGWDQP